jgi:hypothetical protein
MDICYAVPWIEVEFGQRDEGHSIFMDEKECIDSTKESSRKGCYEGGGGYLGPERPLHYYEIPLESLEPEYINKIMIFRKIHTKNNWSPKFKGKTKYIKE